METPGCRHSPWKPLASPPPVSCTPAGCWELCRRETAPWGLGRPRTPTCPQFRNRLRNRRAQCKMKMRAPCSEATESFLESRALNRTRGRLPGVLADCAQSVPVAGAVTPGVRPAQSCRLPPAAHPAAPARPPRRPSVLLRDRLPPLVRAGSWLCQLLLSQQLRKQRARGLLRRSMKPWLQTGVRIPAFAPSLSVTGWGGGDFTSPFGTL